jgi:uncharacterized surface protein with fasciclin (FAS1) repeats
MKFASALTAALLTACVSAQATVVDIVVGSPDHTTLEAAVIAAGLANALSGAGPFTLFAPVDTAFASVNTTRLLLPEYQPHLIDLLAYHVYSGEIMSTDLTVGAKPQMFNGKNAFVTSLNPPTINDATITDADLTARNGVVHVIDKVLLPISAKSSVVDVAVNNRAFSILADLVVTAGLAETLSTDGPFTVFAPTNAAFAKLPKGTIETLKLPANRGMLIDILTYHVTPGVVTSKMLSNGMVTMLNNKTAPVSTGAPPKIGSANITLKDVLVTNGVIHVIDAVLMPPEDGIIASIPSGSSNTVVDVAAGSPDHKTLVAAVTAAGLAPTLSGPGPFTVFAPVDAAFATVDTERLLLPDYKPHLIDLLTYHVLAGQVMSTDLVLGNTPATVNGESVEVTSLNPPMINQANIVTADLPADNGVIHVIDQVLLPASATNTIVDLAVASPAMFSTLVDLVTTAGLAETLSTGGPYTVFAPTNAAFDALPAEMLASLTQPANANLLVDILTYHVSPGVTTSDELSRGMMVPMLNDNSATVSMATSRNAMPMIGGANIISADILATNG